MDLPTFVIYPEIKATEVNFSALKTYLCSYQFRITKGNWGGSNETHFTLMYTTSLQFRNIDLIKLISSLYCSGTEFWAM